MIHPTNVRTRLESSPRLLATRLLTTTDSRIYECPAGKRATVDLLVFCNGATAATLLRFHHAEKGGASTQRNAQFYDTSMAASSVMQDTGTRSLLEGEALRGSAGAASAISVSVYGREADL